MLIVSFRLSGHTEWVLSGILLIKFAFGSERFLALSLPLFTQFHGKFGLRECARASLRIAAAHKRGY